MNSNCKLYKYGVSDTIYFRLIAPDGVDFITTASFATGDIKIMKDGGAEANTTNLPTDEGQGFSLVLTAAELQSKNVVLYIVDQTGTKIWLDTSLEIQTYGNASAQHAFDLDTATQSVNVTQLGGVVQSLTDLKDFADAGYDPSTNKITGVVLVDTTTTNTDMISSAPTASQVADQVWNEAKSGHVVAGSFGEEVQSHSLSTEVSALENISTADVQTASEAAIDNKINLTAGVVDRVTLVDTTTINTDMVSEPLNAAETQTECEQAIDAKINLTAGTVDRVTLVDTTTTNTDMRGTDNGATASALATVDANVDSILSDTNEIQGKLPTNEIMGSSVKTDKDDEIDSIKTTVEGLNDFDPASTQVIVATNNDKTGYSISGTKQTLDALNDVSIADVNAQADQALIDYDSSNGVAKEISVLGIQNNTRFVASIAPTFLVPSAGNNIYKVNVNFYDTDGNMEDPDSNDFGVDLETQDGTDKSALLYKEYALTNALDASGIGGYGKLVRIAEGQYNCFVKIASTETEIQLVFKFAAVENSVSLFYTRSNNLLETSLGTITLADSAANKDIIAEALKERDVSGTGEVTGSIYKVINDNIDANETKIDTIDTVVDAIKLKTDIIPADPATETTLATIDGKVDTVDTVVDAIKVVTDVIPNSGAMTDIDTGINNIEAKLPSGTISDFDETTDEVIISDSSLSEVDAVISANLDVIDIKAKTDTIPVDPATETSVGANGTAIALLENISASEVKAEVVEAINVDGYAEPAQGEPSDTPSLIEMANQTFRKVIKDKLEYDEDTGIEKTFMDDGTTVRHKRTITKTGNVTTKGAAVTGA